MKKLKLIKQLKKKAGFTLLEVLIAIAVTVTVAGMAYTFFDSAIEASESSEAVLKNVNELETVWQLLATDVHHIIDRKLPSSSVSVGSSGGNAPAFMGGDPALSGTNFLQGEYILRFVRDGWTNPLQQIRSDLQRVGYRWQDEQLWREYWAERNQAYDTEPTGRRLIAEDIIAIKIRFLPSTSKSVASGPWVDEWPPAPSSSNLGKVGTMPIAFEITLTLEDMGDVQRTFALPGV
ncbi:MAG: type II secretion system minor pseudopilin GspJ [Cellvibrionaceae bacterium]